MSSSIWKTPDQKPDKNEPIIIRNWAGVLYSIPCMPFPTMREDRTWAYLREVVAQADKAERLQKALIRTKKQLEIATKALKEISFHYQDELDKPTAPAKWFAVATKMCDYADEALEQIEHKDEQ